MKKSAFFYALLTHIAFSTELVEEISQTTTSNSQEIDLSLDAVSLVSSTTDIAPKHTTEQITAAVNAAMYGGPMSNLIFESQSLTYSYYAALMMQYRKSFQTIYRETANLRKHLADQSQTPKAELFNLERSAESIPWSGGATTGVLKYPSMRKNLIESLQKLSMSHEFLPLDNELEYRYISLNFKEWLTFLVHNNSEENQLLTFFLRMVSGKREDGSDDSAMWYYEFDELTSGKGLEGEQKLLYINFFKNQLYDFIGYQPTGETLPPEQEYNLIRSLFLTKYSDLYENRHLKSTAQESASSAEDFYKLSLVQIKFRDCDLSTRSIMFPTQTDDPFNYSNKPFGLLHPPTNAVEYHLGLCHRFFEKARHFKGRKEETLQHILNFSYYWSLCMPFARGSASINEYLTSALLIHHSIGYPKRSVIQELDLYAQSIFTVDEYKEKILELLNAPGSLVDLPYQSVTEFEKETLKKVNQSTEQKSEIAKRGEEEAKPLSNTIPDITYTDGLFIPSTAISINQIDILVSLLKSGHNYKDMLGTIAQNLYAIVSTINGASAMIYTTPRGDLEAEKKCKTAFEKAMIYDSNDATTFENIKEYQKTYNDKPLYLAGHEIVNDLLFFNALCAYHNIVPKLVDGSTLQRPLFKSRHVITSSEARMHQLEEFISQMNPKGNATDLCYIMQRYNSDKSTVHSYTQLYDFLFNGIRSTAENVLEMGIGSIDPSIAYTMGANGTVGASLRGWREYFTQAQIFGADIAEKELFEEDRIKTFFADQLNIATIQSMFEKTGVEKFDVIIDDGLHCFQANHTFLRVAIDHLKEGGIYVIEDIAPRGINAFVELLEKMELDAAFVQLPKNPGRFDNNMFIIFK